MGTRFLPFTEFLNQAVSGTTTYTSPTTDINQSANVGFDVRFTGNMTGTFSILCSNDNVVFTALTFNPAITQPAGSNTNFLVNCNQLPFRYIQTQYTNSSGTGTMTVYLTMKDIA